MTTAVSDHHPLTGRRGAGSRDFVRRSFELAEHFTDAELDALGQLAAAAYGDEHVHTIADAELDELQRRLLDDRPLLSARQLHALADLIDREGLHVLARRLRELAAG